MFAKNYVFYQQNPVDIFDLSDDKIFYQKIAMETLDRFKYFCMDGFTKTFPEFRRGNVIKTFLFYVPGDVYLNVGFCCKIDDNGNTYVAMPEISEYTDGVVLQFNRGD